MKCTFQNQPTQLIQMIQKWYSAANFWCVTPPQHLQRSHWDLKAMQASLGLSF